MIGDMTTIYDCSDNAELLTGMRLARTAVARGELVVMPTDTVYGVAADAFSPEAVKRLLAAKGRGRQAPPPVLIPDAATLDALAQEVPDEVRTLVSRFWPGGLTVILAAQESLLWDLGDTGGTVALRMPSNRVALQLLSETGPLAVSSANRSGEPAAMTVPDAEQMLGDAIAVYLDDGDAGADYPGAGAGTGSTIVDATALGREGGEIRIVREGVIPAAEIHAALDEARAAQDEADAADASVLFESSEPDLSEPEPAEPDVPQPDSDPAEPPDGRDSR